MPTIIIIIDVRMHGSWKSCNPNLPREEWETTLKGQSLMKKLTWGGKLRKQKWCIIQPSLWEGWFNSTVVVDACKRLQSMSAVSVVNSFLYCDFWPLNSQVDTSNKQMNLHTKTLVYATQANTVSFLGQLRGRFYSKGLLDYSQFVIRSHRINL